MGTTEFEGNAIRNKFPEFLLAGLLLLAILVPFFGKALSPNQVLSAADGIYSTPFFAEEAPPHFARPSNPLLFDQVYQFTPWRYFAWKSTREGELPLWNPYSSSGTPFIASMQSAVFYPINLLLSFLPFGSTFVWSAILRLWIAGMFTYALTRYYGLGKIPSLVASISFMLSGFLIVWLGHPHTNVAVWLPALVLLAEILVHAENRRKIIKTVTFLALIIGIQFSGGHIATSVDILFGFALYYLVRSFQIYGLHKSNVRALLRRLVLFPALAVLWGTALAATQLLPFLEWMPNSTVFQERTFTGFELINLSCVRHLLSLPVLIFPNIFNNPTWNYPYWSFLLRWGNYNELALYVGVLTFILAIAASIKARGLNGLLIGSWITVGLFGFARAFRLPIVDWFNQLPGFGLGNPGRLRLIASFSVCILSGFGAEALLNPGLSDRRAIRKLWIKLCALVTSLGLVLMVASNLALPIVREEITAYGKQLVELEYAKRNSHSRPLEYYYSEVDEMVEGLVAAFRPQNISMYMPAIWTLIGLAIIALSMRLDLRNERLLRVAFLVLVTLDLLSFGYDYNPSIPVRYFYPSPGIVSEIARDESLFRMTALRQDLVPDSHLMFGLSDFRGLDFPTQQYNRYLNLVPGRIPWLGYGSIFATVDSPLLRVLNLKYVITSDPELLENDKSIGLARKIGDVYLGEIYDVQPRAFMVYEAIAVQNDEDALHLLGSKPEDVFSRVIISSDGSSKHTVPILKNGKRTPTSNVSLIAYEPNQASWQVSTNLDGYLFVSDAYYPGWKAYVDGVSVAVFRADLAFRSVFVPQGEHVVDFRYEPMSFRLGLSMAVGSLIMVLATLLWSFRE